MKGYDIHKLINNPALDAFRHLQENSTLSAIRELQNSSAINAALELSNTGALAAVRELQKTINSVNSSLELNSKILDEYRKTIIPVSETFSTLSTVYAPLFEAAKVFDSLNIKSMVAGLETSVSSMGAISGLSFARVASIIDALPKYDFLSEMVSDDFTIEYAEKLYENGEITQDDINEELYEIIEKKQFSPVAEWNKFKKSKWFFAIKILIAIVSLVCKPAIDYTTEKVLDATGITQVWEDSGVYEIIDSWFTSVEEETVIEDNVETKAKTSEEIAKDIDVIEFDMHPDILKILLKDKTTGNNILWCTTDYESYGEAYKETAQIFVDSIATTGHKTIIQPRAAKSKAVQSMRIRNKAEVFTPSWVCNEQNNLIDEAWFRRTSVFNTPQGESWIPITDKIDFTGAKSNWKKYIDAQRLEITCGEAPYLVSRYDTTTGEKIPVLNRIGLLDRKLRIVNENCTTDEDWEFWVQRAFESVYGYEFQGDSVLIARENLLYTYIDYYKERFGVEPDIKRQKKIANIIAWNIWQMDGLKFVVPYSCQDFMDTTQYTIEGFFDEPEELQPCVGCEKNDIRLHNGIYCKIKDWRSNEPVRFIDMIGGIK